MSHRVAADDCAATVTVVIPARDESNTIGACLDSILAQSFPAARTEVIVVTAGSQDDTADLAQDRLERAGLHRWEIVRDAGGSRPANLNAGLRRGTGDYLVRVDARSRIPENYISACIQILAMHPEIAVVGGHQHAVPGASTVSARAVARALNRPLGTGWSRYRSATRSGPSDTVYLGCFRREQLLAVGGWDERLLTNEDFDLNRRLARSGVVWYEGSLSVDYVARPRLADVARQYFRFGRWKVRYWCESADPPRPRQVAALTVGTCCLVAGTWALARGPRGWLVLGAAGLGAYAWEVARADDEAVVTAVGLGASAVVAVSWLGGVGVEVVNHLTSTKT